MKPLSSLLIGLILLFVILIVGIFNFMSAETSPQAVIVIPVDPTITHMEEALAAQDALYQSRLTELEQTLQQRQVDFQNQLKLLNDQIAAAQQQLDDLKSQEQALSGQLNQLETRRAEQLRTYQNSLRQSRDQYLARQGQLQTQLEAAQTELNKVKAQLGR